MTVYDWHAESIVRISKSRRMGVKYFIVVVNFRVKGNK
jgi:hypothetical protein